MQDDTRTPPYPARLITTDSLTRDLLTLGLQPGMTLIAHSSMKSLDGWVCGGPVAVIQALQRVLTADGTLVMPTQTSELSDPAGWSRPPVPETWWETIRQTMPPYDPDFTPTRQMGAIAECFRKAPGVLRSAHPQVSFAAWGKHAAALTADHALPNGLGETSPLGTMYRLDSWVLLLGVSHENNTSLHLAEYRAHYPGKTTITAGAPILVDGQRQWVTFPDIDYDSDDFHAVGTAFEAVAGTAAVVRVGAVAGAECRLMRQRALVDFAVDWMEQNRTAANP